MSRTYRYSDYTKERQSSAPSVKEERTGALECVLTEMSMNLSSLNALVIAQGDEIAKISARLESVHEALGDVKDVATNVDRAVAALINKRQKEEETIWAAINAVTAAVKEVAQKMDTLCIQKKPPLLCRIKLWWSARRERSATLRRQRLELKAAKYAAEAARINSAKHNS